MKDDSDTWTQIEVLMKTIGALFPALSFLLFFAIDYPVENWRAVVTFGAAGLLAGSAVAVFATREARRRGEAIDPPSGEAPTRWTLLRAASWLLAVASVVGTVGVLIAGPHRIPMSR